MEENTILFKKHYKNAENIAQSYVMFLYGFSIEEKQEIKQDILVKFYKNVHKFDESKHKLKSFIFQIGKSISIDMSRNKKAEKRINGCNIVYLDFVLDDQNNTLHDLIGRYDEKFDDSLLLTNKINKVLSQFRNDSYRKIYQLFFVEEMKYQEIVDETNINLNTVKTIIFAIRKALTSELTQFKLA
jgi:RNA polymerase sigma factor (sigma-70 family)